MSLLRTVSQKVAGRAPDSEPATPTTPPKTQHLWKKMVRATSATKTMRTTEAMEAVYGAAGASTEEALVRLRNRSRWESTTTRWDKTAEGEDDRSRILHPEHPFRAGWDACQIAALFYVAFLVPFRVGFESHPEEVPFSVAWFVEVVVDIYFTLDIFLNFRTGYFRPDGSAECRAREVRRNYCRSWMALDIISCLPVSYVVQIMDAVGDPYSGNPPELKSLKFLRLLRLFKLLRLARLTGMIKRHEHAIEGLMDIAKFMGLIFVVVYFGHILACSWYFFGEDEQVRLWNATAQAHTESITVHGWIYGQWEDKVSMVSLPTRYLTAYYWALTTVSTVGYGDITPSTTNEKVMAIVAQLFGCFTFATLIGILGSMMMGRHLLAEKVNRQLMEIREFLKIKNIPRPLALKVRRHMETYFAQNSGFDERTVLSQLPPAMAQELLDSMYRKMVMAVPLFRDLEEGAITAIMKHLHPYRAVGGDVIFRRGEAAREMYVVTNGTVEIKATRFRGVLLHKQIFLTAGAIFGETIIDGLLMTRKKRNARPPVRVETVQAMEDCDLKFLTLDSLQKIGLDYPSVIVQLDEIANKRKQQVTQISASGRAAIQIQSRFRAWKTTARERGRQREIGLRLRTSARHQQQLVHQASNARERLIAEQAHDHLIRASGKTLGESILPSPGSLTSPTSPDSADGPGTAEAAELRRDVRRVEGKLDEVLRLLQTRRDGADAVEAPRERTRSRGQRIKLAPLSGGAAAGAGAGDASEPPDREGAKVPL